MAETNKVRLRQFGKVFTDQAARDAFGRLRVCEPQTLWDSKLIGDSRPLFWDDQEVSGSGTGSTYSANRSSETISVTAATAGKRVRQTKQRFNYQPGKSHKIDITATIGAPQAGIIKRVGYFDDKNGLFFQVDEDGVAVGIRSYVTGTAVDTLVRQADWNLYPLETDTANSYALDPSKANIFTFDMEWLGVGSVRFGVVINGVPVYVHQNNHANVGTGVYMTTPNLPIRYEIENDGTGEASELECICSTVISEGGLEETGTLRTVSTSGTALSATTADTIYALIGTRLKADHLDVVYRIKQISLLNESNDNFEWMVLLNPTIAGTFTYNDVTNSALQVAYGATANTVTGGTLLNAEFSSQAGAESRDIRSAIYAGSTIAGVPDELVLCVRPLSNNAVMQGTITYLEF